MLPVLRENSFHDRVAQNLSVAYDKDSGEDVSDETHP